MSTVFKPGVQIAFYRSFGLIDVITYKVAFIYKSNIGLRDLFKDD